MTSNLKLIDSSNFSLPTATSWIEYTRGDDVPPGVVLLAHVIQGEYHDYYTICDYHPTLKVFLNSDGEAVEAEDTIARYHIVHDKDGQVVTV